MPIEGPVPGWILSLIAAATLFAVMFDLGLAIVPGEFRWVVQRPALLLKALFAVLVAVPVLALVVTRAFDLPVRSDRHRADGDLARRARGAAPLDGRRRPSDVRACAADRGGAARRRLDAAVDRRAQRILQRTGGRRSPASRASGLLRPAVAARARDGDESPANTAAAWLEPKLRRLGTVLLVVLLVLVLIDIWHVVSAQAGAPRWPSCW